MPTSNEKLRQEFDEDFALLGTDERDFDGKVIRDEVFAWFEARTIPKAELVERIEGMKLEIGTSRHCETCFGHIAAGECDCNGWNKALDAILSALSNPQEK